MKNILFLCHNNFQALVCLLPSNPTTTQTSHQEIIIITTQLVPFIGQMKSNFSSEFSSAVNSEIQLQILCLVIIYRPWN